MKIATTFPILALSIFCSSGAFAAYPDRPITMIVPTAAGGSGDITARAVAAEMAKILGQPIVIDNKVGVGGRIGTQALVSARPDGYTIAYAHVGTLVLHKFLFKQMPYQIERDIEPIGLISQTPNIFVASSGGKYHSMKQLLDAAQKTPGDVTLGSADAGTTSDAGVKMFKQQTGINVLQVPYKVTTTAVTDLIGGQYDALLENLPPLMSMINSGKLIPLAVTTKNRVTSLPNVPTVSELGYPGYEQTAWSAIVAPRGIPPEIIKTLNEALNKALKLPSVRKEYESRAQEVLGGTPSDVTELQTKEVIRWTEISKKFNLVID